MCQHTLHAASTLQAGSDFTWESPWGSVACLIDELQAGRPLPAANVRDLQYRIYQADRLIHETYDNDHELINLQRAAIDCNAIAAAGHAQRDGAGLLFLSNRLSYYSAYVTQYMQVTQALRYVLQADTFARLFPGKGRAEAGAVDALLGRFAEAIDLPAWTRILAAYTQFIDDRGEKGVVVSLNQRVLAGLEHLDKSARGIASPADSAYCRYIN